MKRETWITIGICCIFLLAAGFFYLRSDTGGVVSRQETGKWKAISEKSTVSPSSSGSDHIQNCSPGAECTVYVCGAVKRPGVYHFSGNSRVCDAVEAAGGFTRKASRDVINQARLLVDGEQITIPKKTKEKISGGPVSSDHVGEGDSSLVDINEADKGELMTLSGIGEAKAQSIIDYRDENGRFSSTGDIMKIPGIKEGIYNKIKDSITV